MQSSFGDTAKGPRSSSIQQLDARCPLWQSSRLSRPGVSRAFDCGRQRREKVRDKRSDEAGQWLLTLFLGPLAVILAGILIGLLLRGTGVR
jgi:hypothetical protein